MSKILKIIILVVILLLIILFFYYKFFLPLKEREELKIQNQKQEARKDLLLKRFNEFSDMINVNLCQEAYNEFIASESKEKKGYLGFQAHCDYRRDNWSNFKIQTVFFSSENRADIKYFFDLSTPDLYSKEYTECMKNIFGNLFGGCSKAAPRKIEKSESIETWLFEDGKWKRDY